jgi:hypothetical protein
VCNRRILDDKERAEKCMIGFLNLLLKWHEHLSATT